VRVLGQLAARQLSLEPRGRAGTDLDVGDGFRLPSIEDVGPDEVTLWEAVVGEVTATAAVARISDLLFLRRVRKAGVHARQAARAYLTAVGDRPDDLNTTTYLLRAWTPFRLVKASDIEDAVLDAIERRIDALVIGDGRNRPGVLYPLIAALGDRPLDRTRAQRLHARANTVSRRARRNRSPMPRIHDPRSRRPRPSPRTVQLWRPPFDSCAAVRRDGDGAHGTASSRRPPRQRARGRRRGSGPVRDHGRRPPDRHG
jgi:hypothetical protein